MSLVGGGAEEGRFERAKHEVLRATSSRCFQTRRRSALYASPARSVRRFHPVAVNHPRRPPLDEMPVLREAGGLSSVASLPAASTFARSSSRRRTAASSIEK